MYPHPQLLFTLPHAAAQTAPTWHVDSPRLPSGQGFGVQMFGFLDTVIPGGGGALAVAGSHHLLNDGRYLQMSEIGSLLRRDDFFQRLYATDAKERFSAMTGHGLVNGFEQKIIELTGEPGDVYLTDLRLLHAFAPNLTDRPRVMVTQRFLRADLMLELAEARTRLPEHARDAGASATQPRRRRRADLAS